MALKYAWENQTVPWQLTSKYIYMKVVISWNYVLSLHSNLRNFYIDAISSKKYASKKSFTVNWHMQFEQHHT